MNPLLHGLPALPQAMEGGFDPISQEEVLGKISKLRGSLMNHGLGRAGGEHAGGGSSLGMMPTHSHTQRWFRVESM